jgi:elongation factor 1-gamma
MAPIGKLHGFSGNSRFRRALAVATYAGLEVETDPAFTMKDGAWKTKDFLKKFPLGYLPAFEGADGLNLQESGAIADYFASLAPNSDLVPAEKEAAAEVREWQYFADQEIMIKTGVAMRMLNNRLPYNKPVFEGVLGEVMARLEVLDQILLKKTFIVGERLTIADIFLATSLTNAFTSLIDAELRAKVPNTVRYTNTVVRHPKIAKVFGKVEYIEKMPAFQAPAKAKKEKAPKEEKPKAEKKEKKPKAKEEEDEDINLAPPEPKKERNPLDDLPKSSFNLEDWKRQYSNLDTRGAGGSLEWFYKNFDWEGFSIWRMDFKYNDELTMTFMSNNQIGGFFTRLEATRKYVFGSAGVLGESNNSIITGALVCRGPDAMPIVEAAPDYESYSFTKLDVQGKPEDKEFFEGALAWDLKIDGKEFVDGKLLK